MLIDLHKLRKVIWGQFCV